jgi:RNA polymerase sigma-70 factor (ECF subfamily)
MTRSRDALASVIGPDGRVAAMEDLPASVFAGDARAVRAFVDAMSPVIEARAARALLRRTRGSGREIGQEIADLTQDVFAALFAHDARVLRSWERGRGLSLANFVGLVAERQIASILRSGRRDPWRDVPEELDVIERGSPIVPDAFEQIASRSMLERLLDRLQESLSARGLVLFHRLYVAEEPVDEVAASMGMTRDAIYAWRSRVGKLVREFSEQAASDDAVPARIPGTGEA